MQREMGNNSISLFYYRWLEAVLGVSLPPATELEAALQNGVVLCRLGAKLIPDDPMWGKVYDMDQSKFKVRTERCSGILAWNKCTELRILTTFSDPTLFDLHILYTVEPH